MHANVSLRGAHRPAALLLALLLSAAAAADDAEPSATPFRPTVASGANLSLPGWLEVEFGGQRQGGRDTDARNSVPYLLKYSLNEQLGVSVGGEAYIRLAPEGGMKISGQGDTALTFKYRAPDRWEGISLGGEASVKLPTAKDGVGSGKRDVTLKGIFGVDLPAGFHMDTNLVASRLGERVDGVSNKQWAWAGAVSHAVGDAWTVAVDLSGTRQRGVASTSQLLGAASYAATRRVVFDGGAAAGLNKATPDWTVFAGVTVLIGRLD